MSRVRIQSYVRVGQEFRPVAEVGRFDGDCDYVPGAISLVVDGVDVMGPDLWDDVNWLWPLVVQALDESRRTGSGKRGFPDQPILFRAEDAWAEHTRVTVTDGQTLNRVVVAPSEELFREVARAGLEFFTQLERLCRGSGIGYEERGTLESWLG